MEFGTQVIVSGITVGIKMNHSQRTIFGDRPENRQGDGVVTARSERCDVVRHECPELLRDVGMGRLQLVRVVHHADCEARRVRVLARLDLLQQFGQGRPRLGDIDHHTHVENVVD